MHSDFSLLDSNVTSSKSPSVDDDTPAVGALSSAPLGGFCKQTLTDEPLTPAKRREMFSLANEMAGYFEAEYRLFWTLWLRDGCFDHKAAYDLALSNFHKATELRESLKKGIKQ